MTADKAAPFVTNFHMVDIDGDGKVSAAEFKAGCKNGWVEEGSDTQLPIKDASPDVPKE
ncbi:MAG: EF-hand domain-containing protein [Bryobacteraceae bacterium]